MKTKKIFLSVMAAMLLSCPTLTAQNNASSNDSNEQLIERKVQRMEKKLALNEEVASQFAPLYKEYLEELEACYTLTRSKKNSEQMTDADREKRMQKEFEYRQWILDTQQEYYSKFKTFLTIGQLETIFYKGNPMRHAMKCKCQANKTLCRNVQ